MALIKKSVSDIERKTKYARIVMRVLKECHLVKEFKEYINTAVFRDFLHYYKRSHTECTDVWYDKERCDEILGCCNFDYYLEKTYGREKSAKCHAYSLVLCYLALFEKEEFERYDSRNGEKGKIGIKKFMDVIFTRSFSCLDVGDLGILIVKNWLKLKENVYGNKD